MEQTGFTAIENTKSDLTRNEAESASLFKLALQEEPL